MSIVCNFSAHPRDRRPTYGRQEEEEEEAQQEFYQHWFGGPCKADPRIKGMTTINQRARLFFYSSATRSVPHLYPAPRTCGPLRSHHEHHLRFFGPWMMMMCVEIEIRFVPSPLPYSSFFLFFANHKGGVHAKTL